MVECFKSLGADKDIRAIVISGKGRLFTGGLDLKSLMQDNSHLLDPDVDIARRSRAWSQTITVCQQSLTQIEQVVIQSVCLNT